MRATISSSSYQRSAGELVVLDVVGVHKRYHVNAARAFSLGEPTPEVLDCAAHAAGAMDRVRDCLRPGLPVRELDEVTRRYFRRVPPRCLRAARANRAGCSGDRFVRVARPEPCARLGDGTPLRPLPEAGSRWTRGAVGAVICSTKGVRSLPLDAA